MRARNQIAGLRGGGHLPARTLGLVVAARRVHLLAMFLMTLAVFSAKGQPLSNLVVTVGTTIQDASLNNWSYVLLGAPQPQLLAGKRFAIYGKVGYPTNNTQFTLRGTIFQQTDTTAINNLLNQSISIGDNLTALDTALATLLHKIPGVGSQALPQKVLTAFQIATADAEMSSALLMLERLHPGLNFCAGQAFSEIITAPTTYEVREVNPNTGVAGDVMGRVTITPGAPVILPAPGFPFQVVTNAPSDHLRIRLRWGTPDALRRLSLLQFGFNVWRIPLAAAQAGGFDITPPTPAQLDSNTNFTKVSTLPVMATKDYAPLAGPGGPDDSTDRTTFFFSDSNERSPGVVDFPPGAAPIGYLNPPFNDGDQFYYFITARDVLGRDGLVSAAGLATACRKDTPSAPTKLSVLNTVQFIPLGGGNSTNQQHLLLRWLQNTNVSDLVTQYWIYRWPNPAMALTSDATPSNNVIGVASQIANTNWNFLLDTDPTSPATPGPSNFWYTVRAVSRSACGSLLFSPNSAPASGVLRQREAPPATTGELVGSCGSPVVVFQQFNSLPSPNPPDTNNWNYRVTVSRRDAGIAWVQLTIGTNNRQGPQSFGPLYFPPDGNSLSLDFTLPAASSDSDFDVICTAGTYYGIVSQTAVCETTTPPGPSQIIEAAFQAGELLFTALDSTDPLLQAVNLNQSSCYPAVNPTRDASGTVHMKFAGGGGLPMMIQYGTNLNGATIWTDIGAATPDSNSVYSVYLCPCVIGPLPQLRGCTINLPADGNCGQHVARAGDSGRIAPIHVKFRLQPRTHEYRLYRSVNGAPPAFISQSQVLYDPLNANSEIVRTDDAMPPSATRVCYYVQLLDENGNGSPLASMGCKDIVPPKPPRPVLSEPVPVGNTTNPQVALSWFCPTGGVYRFEIRIQRADQPGSGKPTGMFSSQLIKLAAFKPLAGTTANSTPRFYGLLKSRNLVSIYDEWQLTPPVGPSFGPGPQFSLIAGVEPNVPYHISVAAENIQGYWGDASSEWTFVWRTPPAFQTVPWPARPLPPVTSFDEPASVPQSVQFAPRVAAVLFTGNATHGVSSTPDAHFPVAIKFATVTPVNQITLNVGNTNFAGYLLTGAVTPTTPGVDPNSGVFKRFASGNGGLQNGQSLLPIVIYRKQETNAAFPRVSGNLAQVTPLLERVPWSVTSSPFNFVAVTIPDRLIAMWQEDWNDHDYTFLGLRDQQPVILGARYHYYAVRMNDQHEVSEVIDAGTVDIPSQ